MTGGVRIFSVFGIDIRVDASWLIVFALLSWSLAAGYFPAAIPGVGRGTSWALGVLAALLFFGSVLLHELSHSLVARRRGIGVRSITLFIFGGVSTLSGEAASSSTEFLVAIVGPLTSLVVAAVAMVASLALGNVDDYNAVAAAAVLGYLGVVNGLVGLFNLIPGYPLDGGRVLRSVVWRVTGSVRRATRFAGFVGQIVAILFVLWGFWRLFDGDIIGGLWIAAIGWFLRSAATMSVRQVGLDEALTGLHVRDVYRREPISVRPEASLEDVVEGVLIPQNRHSIAVADGRLLGVLTLEDVARVPREARASTRVGQLVGGRPLVTVSPDDPLLEAMAALGDGGSGEEELDEVPVVEDGQLVGFLARGDVARAIRLRELNRAA